MGQKRDQELKGVAILVGAIWLVFIADAFLPGDWVIWGITPRTLGGTAGILFSPFLHASLGHLISNTVPLIILTVLLIGSRSRTWPTIFEIGLLSGILLWIFGRPVTHVGASGLIYGLIAFLIVAGFIEKRVTALIVAIVVGFLYGGSLFAGVLPTAGKHVSWDGHLMGAIAGCIVASIVCRQDASNSANAADD